MNYFLYFWKNAFNYQGRARRSEYLSFLIWSMLIYMTLASIEYVIVSLWQGLPIFDERFFHSRWQMGNFSGESYYFSPNQIIANLFAITAIPPLLSVTARRYHDLNKSGWWQSVFILPVVTPFVLVFLPFVSNHTRYFAVIIIVFLYALFHFIKLCFQEGEPEVNRFGESPKKE